MYRDFTNFLLKEGEERITKQLFKSASISSSNLYSYLLTGAQSLHSKHQTKKMASLKKRAMGYFVGNNEFVNSNVTWSKADITPRMAAIEDGLYRAYQPYFKSSGHSPLNPPELVLRYDGKRELFPIGEKSRQSADNAINVIDSIVPGFSDFVKYLSSVNLPVLLYHIGKARKKEEGGFDARGVDDLQDFIAQERERHIAHPLKIGDLQIGKLFFRDHLNIERVQPTMAMNTDRLYSLQDIGQKTSPTELKRWIEWALENGYLPNLQNIEQELIKEQEAALAERGLNNTANLSPQNQELRRNYMLRYTGRDPDNPTGSINRTSMLGRIKIAISRTCREGELPMEGVKRHQVCPILTIKEMQILARNLSGNHPEIGDSAIVPRESTTYKANGLDSTYHDPNTPMPVLPAMKQLPTGQIVYDYDQGNLLGNHARKYGNQISELLEQWGEWADNTLKRLLSVDTLRTLANVKETENEAVDSLVPANAIRTVLYNRTNAENLLEVLTRSPDYPRFRQNVINQSLATNLRNYNMFNDHNAQKTFHFIRQPGDIGQDIAQIKDTVESRLYELTTDYRATKDKMERERIKQAIDDSVQRAKSDLLELGKIYTEQLNNGDVTWDQYTKYLSLIGAPINSFSRKPILKTDSLTAGDADNMIQPQTFEALKKYGYQIAKLMDLVSCLMVASCDDSTNNRYNGVDENNQPVTIPERFYGSNYSTTHGKAGSTGIMLGVRYAFRADEVGSHDAELLKRIRHFRGKHKMRIPGQGGQDVLPQTQHYQRGTPIDPRLEAPGAANFATKIVEEITYWVGQAASTMDFHRALKESHVAQNKSWQEAVDYIQQHYPEIENQLGPIREPINIDLKRLQEASKRALLKVCTELDADAIYQDADGKQVVVEPETIIQDDVLQTEFQDSAARYGVAMAETAVEEPERDILPELPDEELPTPKGIQPVTDEFAPVGTEPAAEKETLVEETREDALAMLDEAYTAAYEDEDMELADKIQRDIDIPLSQGKITTERAVAKLTKILDKLQGSPNQQLEFAQNLINFWEEKLAAGDELPSTVVPEITNLAKQYNITLPPNVDMAVKNYQTSIIERWLPGQQETPTDTYQFEPEEQYDPNWDMDNAMEKKEMPAAGQTGGDYVGKKKPSRSLVRHRPDPTTGKLRHSEVINTLVKSADRLDDVGEYLLANKMSLLIELALKDYDV